MKPIALRRIVALTVALVTVACSGYCEVVRHYRSEPATADQPVEFAVDSIDFRKSLTRVYGRLTGRPHTSGRIDGATLVTDRGSLPATDIDGVDFERYYQFEDDGTILLEIDFTPARKATAVKLRTVRGDATINLVTLK